MKVTASVLNVRSGPGTEFRVLGQVRRNTSVNVLETHGDWAWVEDKPSFNTAGWVSQAYLAIEAAELTIPQPAQIQAFFGPPCEPACSAGRVTLPAPIKLGWSDARVTRVACHILMAPIFTNVFNEIYAGGLWHLLRTFDGIYNCRVVKGSDNQSTHSWGISVDLNAATNRQGTDGDMDARIITIFEKHGFYWGGRFSGRRRDEMHFEYVKR